MLQCAIDHILGHHKVDQVHFGGHSMGGIIGYVLLTDPTARPKFRSMFNLATSLEYIDRFVPRIKIEDPYCHPCSLSSHFHNGWRCVFSYSSYRAMKPLLPLTEVMDFLDLRSVMKIYAPFVVWPSMLAHMTNVKRSTLQKVLNEMELVPTAVRTDNGWQGLTCTKGTISNHGRMAIPHDRSLCTFVLYNFGSKMS